MILLSVQQEELDDYPSGMSDSKINTLGISIPIPGMFELLETGVEGNFM